MYTGSAYTVLHTNILDYYIRYVRIYTSIVYNIDTYYHYHSHDDDHENYELVLKMMDPIVIRKF